MLLPIVKGEKEVDSAQRDNGRLTAVYCLDDAPVYYPSNKSSSQ